MYQLTWLPAIKPGLFHFWQSQCGLLMNSADLLYLNESCLHFNLDCLRTTSLFRDGQVNALLIRAQLKAALKEKNLCLKRTANVTKNILQGCGFLYSVSSKLRRAGSVPRRAYHTNFALKVFHADSGTNFAVRIRRGKLTFLLVFLTFAGVARRETLANFFMNTASKTACINKDKRM